MNTSEKNATTNAEVTHRRFSFRFERLRLRWYVSLRDECSISTPLTFFYALL
jgi:hypothetical protein